MSSPCLATSLHAPQDIFDFFRENREPLFYVSTSTYNILGSGRLDRAISVSSTASIVFPAGILVSSPLFPNPA